MSDKPLLVYETAKGPKRQALGAEPLLIGRGVHANLRLGDRSLSARHCQIEPAPEGGHEIVDLDSRNGTFVNGRAVTRRRLAHGDRIRMGRVELVYRASAAAEDDFRTLVQLVDRIHKRGGPEGVREAAARFTATAGEHGLPDLLAASDAVRAADHVRGLMRAMVEAQQPEDVFGTMLDSLIALTGAERGFFLLHPELPATPKRGRRKGSARKRSRAKPSSTASGKAGGSKQHTTVDIGPLDSDELEGRVVASRNVDRKSVRDAALKISRSVARAVREGGEPVIVTDALGDERFTGNESIVGMQLRSILAVPVTGRGGPGGTIYLDHRFERDVFLARHLPLIHLFADYAAIALQSARLHAERKTQLAELTAAHVEVEELNRILSDRVAQTSAELHEVREQVLRDRDEAPLKYNYGNIIGTSRAMREVFHLLDKVTDSDVPVLIQGESGTGKELVARALHFNGSRKRRPFVSENCAAIPETLLESELFGYTKGSFTGATSDRKGLFESANGGTMFLDEIGDMPMDMQKKLLRVLQEGEVRRIGGSRKVPIDVRVVAASNRDLRAMVDEGAFREDLFYRLNVITVALPPLRERREDVPLLVQHFLEEAAGEQPPRPVSEEAMAALVAHRWPGNVRELRNEVLRATALSDRIIVPEVLSPALRGAHAAPPVEGLGERPLKEMVKEVTEGLERQVIQAALTRCEGRKARAARMLGISRPTLDAKISLYDLRVQRS